MREREVLHALRIKKGVVVVVVVGGGFNTLSTGVNASFCTQLISKLSALEHTPRKLQPGQQFLMLPTTMPGSGQ